MCFNFGCSSTELLSLHRSSPHTWLFWRCRWRLSTTVSLYLTHPLRLNFFVLLRFLYVHPHRASSPVFFQPVSLLVHQSSVVIITFSLQEVESSSGTACFRPFSYQLTTILPVFYHLFSLFSSAPSLRGHQCTLLFYVNHPSPPQWHLQCHLTSHPINLQGWLMGNDVCWINVTEWMMKRVRCLDGGSSVDMWETTWRVGETDSLEFVLTRVLCPPPVSLLRFISWHQSVQSSLIFSQCHEGPEHRLRRGRSSRRCTSMKNTTLP